MNDTVHIASLLVQATQDKIPAITDRISRFGGADLAHSDDQGRMIVTLETSSEAEIVQALTDIQLLTGVVSASLVYHQVHSEAGTDTAGN